MPLFPESERVPVIEQSPNGLFLHAFVQSAFKPIRIFIIHSILRQRTISQVADSIAWRTTSFYLLYTWLLTTSFDNSYFRQDQSARCSLFPFSLQSMILQISICPLKLSFSGLKCQSLLHCSFNKNLSIAFYPITFYQQLFLLELQPQVPDGAVYTFALYIH